MNLSAMAALLSGVLFGAGLVISGMTVPANVVGFLDFAGAWNPSLAFVMGGAIAVHMPLYWLIRRRKSPLFDTQFHVPSRRDIDWRLLVGSAVFGVGWAGGVLPRAGACVVGEWRSRPDHLRGRYDRRSGFVPGDSASGSRAGFGTSSCRRE